VTLKETKKKQSKINFCLPNNLNYCQKRKQTSTTVASRSFFMHYYEQEGSYASIKLLHYLFIDCPSMIECLFHVQGTEL